MVTPLRKYIPSWEVTEMIKLTPHPDWALELIDYLQPYKERIVNSNFFEVLRSGSLRKKQFQWALINFFPLIESFPQYMGLNLSKLQPDGSKWNRKTRLWLMLNLNVERRHAAWWRNLPGGFGVTEQILDEAFPPPAEVEAINHYLWHISTHGSLAESISAVNYAIEGPTGEWTKKLCGSFKRYAGVEGIDCAYTFSQR